MAKISTYPLDSNVTLSDKVIGTDVENNNATKNFSVGDMLSLVPLEDYVPYTGATTNVDLGTFGIEGGYGIFTTLQVTNGQLDNVLIDNALFTNAVNLQGAELGLNGDSGTLGYVLISQGSGTNPIWYNPMNFLTGYVPYTGATGTVDLGTQSLLSGYVESAQSNFGIMYVYDTLNINNDVPIVLDTDPGISGQVLTSQGPLNNPIWTTPITSAFANYYSTATQQHIAVGAALPVDFPNVIDSSGVTVLSSNEINFANAGLYKIELRARVDHTSGGGDAELSFWLKDSVTNVANSRQDFTVANTHTEDIIYSFMLLSPSNGKYFINWSTTNIAAQLISTAASGFFPVAPSTLLNVYKVG